jgi:hypothetical protein
MKCLMCGGDVKLAYSKLTNEQMTKHSLCFECSFWRMVEESLGDGNSKTIITDEGQVYGIIDDPKPREGMELSYVRDGTTEVVRCQAWHLGNRPAIWANRLPSNAKRPVVEERVRDF